MLKEIGECLHSLSVILDNIEQPTVSTRLKNIESKLILIESKLQRQSNFAVIVFIYGLALSTIAIGLAIRVEYPSNALVLMCTGLGVLVVLAIVGIVLWFHKKFRFNM